MKRFLVALVVVGLSAVDGHAAPLALPSVSASASAAPRAGEPAQSARVRAVSDAITELDVERAKRLVEAAGEAPDLTFERARLAVYLGDCAGADAIVAKARRGGAAVPELAEVALGCARATAAALIVEDPKAGIWVRLADDEDRALVPFIVATATRARAALRRDLGVELPRPLRIELTRDLFSLCAVTGLPLEAAETTGTVAVARWGRVTIISPRATPHGYPWEDTLAHELTHLAVSRATRDHAPLWLQEGLAKREETRWREPRPFDRTPAPDDVAKEALLSGKSVGVQAIGPSIAMLPTPDAAAIAFAEVTSFVGWWIAEQGEAALMLLFADLRGTGSPDSAMRSVTGWGIADWVERWRRGLLERAMAAPDRAVGGRPARFDPTEIARRSRLGELLYARGHAAAAAASLGTAVEQRPTSAAVRFALARARRAAGAADLGRPLVVRFEDVTSLHGGWCALRAWYLRQDGDDAGAVTGFGLGLSVDPLSEEVACEGELRARGPDAARDPPAKLPSDAAWRALCEAARRLSQQ